MKSEIKPGDVNKMWSVESDYMYETYDDGEDERGMTKIKSNKIGW